MAEYICLIAFLTCQKMISLIDLLSDWPIPRIQHGGATINEIDDPVGLEFVILPLDTPYSSAIRRLS